MDPPRPRAGRERVADAPRAGALARPHRRWSYADLEALPETTERTEILDGDLIVSPAPHALRHQSVVLNLASGWRAWAHRAGRVFVAPCDVVLSETRVVQPDVLFVAAARIGIVDRAVVGAPDVVAEVLSPGNARLDRTVKFHIYEEAGVPECWMLDPETETVEVFALADGAYVRHDAAGRGGRVTSAHLPGFAVDVDDLFDA